MFPARRRSRSRSLFSDTEQAITRTRTERGAYCRPEAGSFPVADNGVSPLAFEHVRRLWRIFRRLFFVLRLLVWLVVLVGVSGYAYLHFAGVPASVREKLIAELRHHGVEASFGRIQLELPANLIARDVSLGDARQPDRPVVRARRVALGFDFRNLWRGSVTVDTLHLDGGTLSVPVDWEQTGGVGGERIEAQDLNGRVRLLEENVLDVEQLAADVLGLRVMLQGRLRLPKNPAPPKALSPEERAARAEQMRKLLAEVRSIKWSPQPLISMTFNADSDRLENAEVSLKLEAQGVTHPKFRCDKLRARLHFGEQLLLAQKVELKVGGSQLSIEGGQYNFKLGTGRVRLEGLVDPVTARPLLPPAWQEKVAAWDYRRPLSLLAEGSFTRERFTADKIVVGVAGGTLTVSGYYDAKAAIADMRVESTADLKQLTVLMPKGWQRQLADWTWKVNPSLGFNLLWSGADAKHPTISGGVISLTDAAFRGIVIQRAVARATLLNDVISITDAIVQKPEGTLRGNYSCQLTQQDFSLTGVESTADPFTLTPLMGTNAVNVLRQFTFDKPPTVTDGWWRGNWKSMDSHSCAGGFAAGPMTFRSVKADAVESRFAYTYPELTLTKTAVHRPEGVSNGSYRQNFSTSDFSGEVAGPFNVAALRPALGEGALRFLDAYRLDGPCDFNLKNVSGNWLRLAESTGEGRIRTGPMAAGVGRAQSVSATFQADRTTINISKFRIKVASGEVEGTLRHDRKQQRIDVAVGSCIVQPLEIAQLLGTNAAAAISPYRCAKTPTLRDVQATIDMRNASNTSWRAQVHVPRAGWWRLQADDVFCALSLSNNVLTVTNFQANSFYGGRLMEAWGRFDLNKNPLHYKVAFRLDDARKCGELLETMFGYSKASGTLQGRAEVSGIFGDYDSITGRGEGHLSNAHMWNIPIFGALSTGLGYVVTQKIANPPATNIDTTFRVEKGFVFLPAAEGDEPATIRAPPHKVTARGKWRIQGDLDFIVWARFLGESGWVTPLGWLTDPVTGLLQRRMEGTLGKPQFSAHLALPGMGGGK